MSENIVEFPVIKELDGDEALTIALRLKAQRGVIVYDCPCGCGRVKCIEIGEPSHRDMLFYAEHLRGYTMEEYCDMIDEEAGSDEIS